MKTGSGIVVVGVLAALVTPLGVGQAEAATVSQKALSIAAAQKGDPYQYGAEGPKRFDCSGLTWYSFRHAGKSIPRVAQDQYNKSRKIRARDRKPGDLVFFGGSRSIYHVGIYAGWKNGKGWIWHAPKPGRRVEKVPLWTSSVRYGRF